MLKINDKHSYDTFCKEKGESLECIGIREYVFTRKHALELVDLIDSPKIAIVGGDIYRKNNLDFESTCDSWHYEIERNTIKGVILVDDE